MEVNSYWVDESQIVKAHLHMQSSPILNSWSDFEEIICTSKVHIFWYLIDDTYGSEASVGSLASCLKDPLLLMADDVSVDTLTMLENMIGTRERHHNCILINQ